METIAPLAKVLAEANGIEWRTLRGTGAEGLITEQDILGYLARVMSGEEDAPLTPVDPEPSPAELAAYSSPEMLSRAGVEADLTDFMKLHAAQLAAAPAPSETADFELDDEIEIAELEPVAAGAEYAAAPLAAEYAETEPVHIEPEPVAAEVHEPDVHSEPVIHEPVIHEPVYIEPAYTEPVAAQAPVPTPEPITPPPPFTMPPVAAPAAAASGGLLGGLLSSLYRNKGDKNADKIAADKVMADKVMADKVAADKVADDHAAEVAAAEKAAAEKVAADHAAEVAAAEAQIAAEKAAAEHEAAQRAAAEAERMAAEKAVADQAAATYVEPVPVLGEVMVPEVAVPEVAVPEVHTPAAPIPAAAMPVIPAVAWSGTYLRRDVDLLAMMDAQSQLADVLGESVPVTLLLARAAQRHLSLLNLSGVAVANAQGHALEANLGGDLRSAVTALHGAQPGGHAELLILDAGALDLDDLHYPHAVTLSLGRVSSGKAALSLNGNLDVQQGARFLAEVCALIATPVKLLV